MGRVGRLLNRSVDLLRERLEELTSHRYDNSPLCDAPLAPPSEYQRRWTEARLQSYPVVDRYEETCGAAIDPEWFHELALLTQVTMKRSAICYQHGRLLYATLVRYTRSRAHDHLTIVETGTARGFSALCLAKALDDAGATGRIVSFDVLPHDVSILWNCIRDADGRRTRADLLKDYAGLIERYAIFHRGDTKRELAKMSLSRVHFAFLDSVHSYDHVMAEFSSIRDRQRAGDILFFDDYTPDAYPGVVKAADEICLAHGYSRNVVTANTQRRYLIAEKQ
ncbi:MAG: class I SAM-dependent methyltransferase [Acidobacteria bacterium]|nr:class I SAM-dependent methyltransferase [Acidobacteriota bacterium]